MASLHQTSIAATPDTGVPAAEFGASLREIRLAHQRKLSDVSDDLRIRQVFLQAIEDGHFDDLPGPTYAVGFVRAYADYLGLDVEEVIRSFKELGIGSNRQPNLVPPAPVAEGKLPTGSVLLVAGIVLVAAYGGWLYVSADGKGAGEVVTALPQRIAALVGMSTEPEPPATPSAPATFPAPGPPAAAVQEEPGETGAAATAPPAAPTAPAEPSTAETAAGDTPPDEGDASSEQVETAPARVAADSAAASETPASETPAPGPAATATAAIQTPAATVPEPPPPPAQTAPQPEPVETGAVPPPVQTAAASEPAETATPAGPTPGQARPPVSDAPSPASSAMTATPAEPAAAPATQLEPVAASEAASLAPAAGAESAAEPVPAAVAVSSATTPPEVQAAPAPDSAAPAAAQIADAPVADAQSTQQEPPSHSAPSPSEATPAGQQTAAVPVTPSPQTRVTVRATTNTWVEVRKSDGQPVFSRMMQSGEAVDLPVIPGMTLSTGNAGGIEIMVEGEVLPPLGPRGAIRRNVALDSEALLKKTGRAQ